MGRIETGVKALAACAVLAFAVGGCSGGVTLTGEGDDDARPSTDDGEDGTCPPEALARGRCSTEDATCRMPVACQPCAREVWTWFATDCWCAGGSWRCSHPDCFPPYGPGNYSDPACTTPWGAGGEADADADATLDAEAEVDADDGVGAEADGDGGEEDGDAGACIGGWYDPTSGLSWQNPPPIHGDPSFLLGWREAVEYCDALDLGGHGPGCWHLPTIDELRSLVRGCPDTETGGSCGVNDVCLGEACWDLSCAGCPESSGPGRWGAYWPSEIGGEVSWYWSSSRHDHAGGNAWLVQFNQGFVSYYEIAGELNLRCVRPGP